MGVTKEQLELDVLALEKRKLDLQISELEEDVKRARWENGLVEGSPKRAGEFILLGDVTEASVHHLMSELAVWTNLHPGEPITLTINSGGGIVIEGLALYDYLERLRRRGHHITTVGMGLVASMAAILLQVGDERVMTSRCSLMIHEVHGIAAGRMHEMKNSMQWNERLQTYGLEILAERSNWGKTRIKNRWKEDLWFDAEAALKAGFIDRIEA